MTKYNLVREKWIRVLGLDGNVREVSLSELFRNAHSYRCFAGESEPQDLAVMRVCLAVMHAALGPGIKCPDDAFDLVGDILSVGRLPDAEILAYLDKWADRFWLVHPERPFFQRPCAAAGTGYNALKLDGTLFQSNNKPRFFSEASLDPDRTLSFSEAARWLVHLIAFDDNASKSSDEYKARMKAAGLNGETAGAGWLGKCGPVFFEGDDLFHTLMLNLVLLRPNGDLYGPERPCWELDEPRDGERTRIPCPDNLSELYTIQSRRVILDWDGACERVVGYHLLGGDFFEPVNAFIEPMTIWYGTSKDKKGGPVDFRPRQHDPAERFWRTLPGLFGHDLHTWPTHRPGILDWAGQLVEAEVLRDMPVHVRMVSIKYADAKCFNVADSFSEGAQDGTALSVLVTSAWQDVVVEAVSKTADAAASHAWTFARDAAQADGMEYVQKNNSGPAAAFAGRTKARFYELAGDAFRTWLSKLDPATQDCGEAAAEFRKDCVRCARRVADEALRELSPQAMFGRPGKKFSAADALNRLDGSLGRFEREG